MLTEVSQSNDQQIGRGVPYPPSYLDRFMRFVQRLPVPYWLTYLLLFFLQSILFTMLAWMDGSVPLYRFRLVLFLFPLWMWMPLAIMTRLNSTSEVALSIFSPLLDAGEEELKDLRYLFTTLPSRGVILNGILWVIVYGISLRLMHQGFLAISGFRYPFIIILYLEGMATFFFGSALYYQSLRQLRLVTRTVRMVKRFNLFQLDPVYSLSMLTSQIGISWMALAVLSILIMPFGLATGVVLGYYIVQVILALAAFMLPLQKIHSLLVAQKRKYQSELNQRVELTLKRFHHGIDENQLGDAEQLNEALAGLNVERDLLKSIPTWPWRSGTLTSVLSAIVLPVFLIIIQLVIQNWLGK